MKIFIALVFMSVMLMAMSEAYKSGSRNTLKLVESQFKFKYTMITIQRKDGEFLKGDNP